jgi:aryl-alcohol dehydrogenase-like predicted oxidoreductase
MTHSSNGGVAPGRTGVGTWSGGRFMNFGEKVDEDRLAAVLRPGGGISTVITADTYGQGGADRLLGRAIAGVDRGAYSLIGAVGHDFYEGERAGAKGFPRFTDPRLRGPADYAGYLRMATESSLERLGQDRLDLLLLHNPDHTGYTSEVVWDAMAALRDEGLATQIGVAPGPANGFTLDMLDCFDRFGDRIDWAMIILNPLEPWPGEMVLDAAAAAEIGVITRVVDYGGLFWGDVTDIDAFPPHDHRRFRPAGWIEAGNERIEGMRPIAERRGLTPLQLACQWNLAHPAVRCVVPTLIQEAGTGARPIEDKRAELAALPEQALAPEDVAEIRRIGDNRGSMKLKGATPAHEGEPVADSWPLDPELLAAGERWGVDPDRDLVMTAGA